MQYGPLLALLSCLATLTAGSPIQARNNDTSSGFLPGDIGLNITYIAPVNRSAFSIMLKLAFPPIERRIRLRSSLPNVAIFATGGTIAGASASSSDTTTYTSGVVGVAALVKAVPEISNIANIEGVQVSLPARPAADSILTIRDVTDQQHWLGIDEFDHSTWLCETSREDLVL